MDLNSSKSLELYLAKSPTQNQTIINQNDNKINLNDPCKSKSDSIVQNKFNYSKTSTNKNDNNNENGTYEKKSVTFAKKVEVNEIEKWDKFNENYLESYEDEEFSEIDFAKKNNECSKLNVIQQNLMDLIANPLVRFFKIFKLKRFC